MNIIFFPFFSFQWLHFWRVIYIKFLKAYYSLVFTTFSLLCSHYHLVLKYFPLLQKENPYPLAATLFPSFLSCWQPLTYFYLYCLANSRHFKWNHTICSLCDWLLLWSERCHCMGIPCFVYIVTCRWTCRSFLLLASVNSTPLNSHVQLLFCSFRYIARSEIAESYGNFMFNFLRNHCAFSLVPLPLKIPTNNIWGFQFLHILANTCGFFVFSSLL